MKDNAKRQMIYDYLFCEAQESIASGYWMSKEELVRDAIETFQMPEADNDPHHWLWEDVCEIHETLENHYK